jgi:cell division protein FtsQ
MSSIALFRSQQKPARRQRAARNGAPRPGEGLRQARDRGKGAYQSRGEASTASAVAEARRRSSAGEARARRIFGSIIAFLLIVLAMEVAFHLFIAPELVIGTVNIRARDDFAMSNAQILEAAGIHGKPYYFSVSPSQIEAQLERVPMVRDAQVNTRFPDTMTISITGREPLGLLMVQGENGLQQALVDRQGLVFRVGGTEVPDLPVISGIEIPRATAGMRLPDEIVGFLADLAKLRQEAPELYRLISEVKFVKKNKGRFEVLLYPAHYRIRVRLGPTLDTHTFKYIMLVLDVISGRGMEDDIVEVDFRTEHVVYRVGEE